MAFSHALWDNYFRVRIVWFEKKYSIGKCRCRIFVKSWGSMVNGINCNMSLLCSPLFLLSPPSLCAACATVCVMSSVDSLLGSVFSSTMWFLRLDPSHQAWHQAHFLLSHLMSACFSFCSVRDNWPHFTMCVSSFASWLRSLIREYG